jgi:hypothetical protein
MVFCGMSNPFGKEIRDVLSSVKPDHDADDLLWKGGNKEDPEERRLRV